MAVEPGGIADKLGGIYERDFAAEQLLDMVAGRVRRLRWEPAAEGPGNADIEVERCDGVVEHVQLKRQNRSDAEWSVATLHARGVLSAAARYLSSSPTSRYTFVSSDPVLHLKDICDQVGRSVSPEEFFRERVCANRGRLEAFEVLNRYWGLDSSSRDGLATAVARLQRMSFIVRDRGEYGRGRLLLAAQLALTGEPEGTVGLLASFLEERLGRYILPAELLDYLLRYDVRPQDLARDPSLRSALLSLREEFRAALRERLIGGDWIPRPDIGTAMERLAGPAPPRVLFVHGKPGVGKSGVLLGIADELIARSVPVLPLSLADRPPDGSALQYGRSLGLHASPVAALRATTGQGRRAVLLLDQLDALRLTTSAAVATWRVCLEVLREALADPHTVLVVACRTFDLENDPNIVRWREWIERPQAAAVEVIEVAELTPDDVRPVVHSFGMDYARLPPRLQHLLLLPSALDAWCRLARRGSRADGFATLTQLLGELIKTLRLEAGRIHGVTDGELQAVLDRAREYMELHGRLSVPKSDFDDLSTASRACCAVGLLVSSGGSLAFPHQGYFDHLVARVALRASSRDPAAILKWVKQDPSLRRRDQLRQLLLVVRDEDPLVATTVTAALLDDPAVRFHLKQLALGVLRDADPITPDDADLVVRLTGSAGWVDHIRPGLLWRSPGWFDALDRCGAWATWLGDSRQDARLEWLRVFLSVMRDRPEAVDRLIQPLLPELRRADTLSRVLLPDPSEDSPTVAKLREEAVGRGEWAVHVPFLDRVAERDRLRVLRLTLAVIRGALRRTLRSVTDHGDFRESMFERQVGRAVRTEARRAFPEFSRLLLATDRLKARVSRRNKSPDIAEGHFRISAGLDQILEILTKLTAQSVAGLAEDDLALLAAAVESPRVGRSGALSTAVAAGLKRAREPASDVALNWLSSQPARLALRQSHMRDAHGLAADIIRRHASHCSAEVLAALEEALLGYFPPDEKEDHRWSREHVPSELARGSLVGQAQHLLLAAIPEDRRSIAVHRRLGEWSRKFGGPAEGRPDLGLGGWVGSPIPSDRLDRVPDRQWLRMVARSWTGRRRRQVAPERMAHASPEHFAQDLGQCAERSPVRFVRLALRFPENTPPVFFEHLWRALTKADAAALVCEPEELDALMDRTVQTGDRNAIAAACWAVQAHPGILDRGATWRLAELAASHEEPKAGEYMVYSTETGGRRRPDLEETGLNCVRGAAAFALAALAWNNPLRSRRVVPLARKLAADPHPAVRLAAARTALAVYTTDKEEGVALLLTLAGHENDQILGGRSVREAMAYGRWHSPGRLYPLFGRMVRSADSAASEGGASLVTAEFFQRWRPKNRVVVWLAEALPRALPPLILRGACGSLYRKCRSASVSQRLGVARTLTHLLADESVCLPVVEAELKRFFADPDSDVRGAAAEAFREGGALDLPSGPRLAAAFVETPAFLDHSEALMWPLAHEPLDLGPYASAVFRAADRFAHELAPQTRSIQYRLGLAGREVSSLLLRLYDAAVKAGEQGMASSCLDRWDSLLAGRVGDSDVHLESYE